MGEIELEDSEKEKIVRDVGIRSVIKMDRIKRLNRWLIADADRRASAHEVAYAAHIRNDGDPKSQDTVTVDEALNKLLASIGF